MRRGLLVMLLALFLTGTVEPAVARAGAAQAQQFKQKRAPAKAKVTPKKKRKKAPPKRTRKVKKKRRVEEPRRPMP